VGWWWRWPRTPTARRNDAKLVPALLPQGREHVRGNRLWVADRQFVISRSLPRLCRPGIIAWVRYHSKTPFCPEAAHPGQRGQDAQGRVWEQDWGWLGM